MAVYSKQEGPFQGPQSWDKGFRQTTSVDFPSALRKPAILVPTSGDLTMTFCNSNVVDVPYWGGITVCNAFGPLTTTTSGPGNDGGLLNSAIGSLAGGTINAAVSLLELPETLAMLWKAAIAAEAAIRLFLKGKFLQALQRLGQKDKLSRRELAQAKKLDGKPPGLKTAEDLHLEMTLGWTPFINDVQGVVTALSNQLEVGKKRRSTRSNDNGKSSNRRNRPQGYKKTSNVSTAEGFTRVTAGGTIENSQQALLNSLGLNPLANLWETIPYSFVLDYFLDIGGFLASLTGTAGFTNVWACKVTQTVVRYNRAPYGEAWSHVSIARRAIYGAGVPLWPGLDVAGVSMGQTTNMAALLSQRLRTR